ncbi:Outer membrane protein MIP precursor [Botrimarina colliarenosi]|uniref:Peptidyl-prolyl cis-trans isomerase n=1 Tax=Botrimarina colliarenosi TaxID=2528001 RepID=A0A5C6AKW7_9BACT|nr:FKBP-type peptidyl-prolyl cis-trans isomerase [Botrimarina colliarenosi]TWU00663.1 Outer membrane protein MIP precursor [Botrimarina colliarenosi]
MRVALAAASFALAAFLTAVPAMSQEVELPPPGEPAGQPDDEAARFNEKVGYCIGLDLGRRLADDAAPVDLGAIVAGLRDGLSGAEPQLTDEQVAAVMDRFQQLMQQKAETKMAQEAQENLVRGEKFLTENRGKEGVQETDSGLQYRVIEEGEGDSPGLRDTVRCHYEGTLISGEVFDSSYKRGQPAEFPVGGVIDGWTEALQMMKVGAKWEVFLPAKIAYGLRGAPGAIGPNETLVFTIELIDIVD